MFPAIVLLIEEPPDHDYSYFILLSHFPRIIFRTKNRSCRYTF